MDNSIARRTILTLRLLVGGVFLYAAYTKLRQPWLLFAMSIDTYQVLPEWGVLAVARALPWTELALGSLLVLGRWMKAATAVSAALLASFFALMVHAYGTAMGIDCGCFGVGEAISPVTLSRDGLLLALAVTLAVMAWRSGPAAAAPGARA